MKGIGYRARAIASLLGAAPLIGATSPQPEILCVVKSDDGSARYSGYYNIENQRLSYVSSETYAFSSNAKINSNAINQNGDKYLKDDSELVLVVDKSGLKEIIIHQSVRAPEGTASSRLHVSLLRNGKSIASDTDSEFDGLAVHPRFPAAIASQLGEPFDLQISLDGRIIGVVHFNALSFQQMTSAAGAMLARNDKLLAGSRYIPRSVDAESPCSERSEGCFLTTAAVGAVGLSDDCWELRQLRTYRERHRNGGDARSAAIAEYPTIAPAIVQAISKKPNAQRIWLRCWLTGIIPAAIAASCRLDQLTFHIYRRMIRNLQAHVAA